MTKVKYINAIMLFLCLLAILINHYFEDYKTIGIFSIALMGILVVFKEKLYTK